ncbi:LysR family transcriptional regulator [Denitromonas iodatirespirans]|uniref:LysR family transcriptional regulator n=1 Tax=Denitromonas iodatirespirans TaxID=2795389 RepID=A0A944D8Y7_DENI1|nr:LysR family transcriptional regulator [Denitromonas iodatirespirans]MBT0960706.1 LysR family transcriptional regulator [Denitromonas iodatirespirans]
MADRRLQVFNAVVKHGSFTRAAERLFMTQPAVTFQIKQLEEHFNTRLLERGHGYATLTPAGEIVHNYAERILALNEEMEARVAELTDELTGTLNIGTSTTIAAYWLPKILEGFKRLYPLVIPRVSVGNSSLVAGRVANRDLDLGMIEIVTDDPSLERRGAAQDELMVICSPRHKLARAEVLSATDLLPYPFITREPGNAIRELADQYFAAAGIGMEEVSIAAELGSLAAVKQLAAEGFGFGIASHAAIQRDIGEGRLAAVPLSPKLYTPLEVIFPKDRFRSRLITTFAEFAAEQLAAGAQR